MSAKTCYHWWLHLNPDIFGFEESYVADKKFKEPCSAALVSDEGLGGRRWERKQDSDSFETFIERSAHKWCTTAWILQKMLEISLNVAATQASLATISISDSTGSRCSFDGCPQKDIEEIQWRRRPRNWFTTNPSMWEWSVQMATNIYSKMVKRPIMLEPHIASHIWRRVVIQAWMNTRSVPGGAIQGIAPPGGVRWCFRA